MDAQILLATMDVLDAQFNILNIEGLHSSLYMERYTEPEGEIYNCPRCFGHGSVPAHDDWGYLGDVDCPDCEGAGDLEKETEVIVDDSWFESNIII